MIKLGFVKAKTYIKPFLYGGLYGGLLSWVVNSSLFEISQNVFFSTYFGLLFIIIGFIILWRIMSSPFLSSSSSSSGPGATGIGSSSSSSSNSTGIGSTTINISSSGIGSSSGDNTPFSASSTSSSPSLKKYLLILFSVLIIFSGFLCFALEKNPLHLSATTRIPLFTILGVSTCFALTFSSIDVVNAIVMRLRGDNTGIVETPAQVYLILGMSIVMGAIYGFVFGYLDIEDQYTTLGSALFKDESFSFPIGFVLGAVAGVYNFRQTESYHQYSLLSTSGLDNFNDGISTKIEDDDEI